jgi:hypothetical protein
MSTGNKFVTVKALEIILRRLKLVNSGPVSSSYTITYPINFNNLVDVPQIYTGRAGGQVRVNSGEDGLEFTDGAVETKTDDYVVVAADFGKMILMNAAGAKVFTLPAVVTADVDRSITLVKRGAGKVTIQAAAGETIDDSTVGGTLYNDLSQAEDPLPLARLKVIAAGEWIIEYTKGSGWRTS